MIQILFYALTAIVGLMAVLTIIRMLILKSDEWVKEVCKIQVLGKNVKYFYFAVLALNIVAGLWACLSGLSWWWLFALPLTVLVSSWAITWITRGLAIILLGAGKFAKVAWGWLCGLVGCDLGCNIWNLLKDLYYAIYNWVVNTVGDLLQRLWEPIKGYFGIFKKGF